MARGPVGKSILRDLFGWPGVGEGDRADAVRFCPVDEPDGSAWLIAWL